MRNMESRRRAGYNALLARAFIGSLSLALFAVAGLAAPFKPTPASFASWYNATQKRQDGKIFVQDLAECSHRYYNLEPNPAVRVTGGSYESYSCDFGYATTTNPMGKKVCKLAGIWWEKNLTTGSVIANHMEESGACRWAN